jgi:hypothetical protein
LREEHLGPDVFRNKRHIGEVDDGGMEEKAEAVEGLDWRGRKSRINGRGASGRWRIEEAAVMDCG